MVKAMRRGVFNTLVCQQFNLEGLEFNTATKKKALSLDMNES